MTHRIVSAPARPVARTFATLMAAVKAVALRFRATDHRPHVWRPVVGWCLVTVAFAMNAFCYIAIARALR